MRIVLDSNHKKYFLFISCFMLGIHFFTWGIMGIDIRGTLSLLYSFSFILYYFSTQGALFKFNAKQIIMFLAMIMLLIQGQSSAIRSVWIVLFLFCIFNCEYSDLLQILCKSSLALSIILIITILTGSVDYKMYMTGERIRWTLGDANVNGVALFFLSLLSPFLLKINTIKCKTVCSFVMLLVYIFTDSRTSAFTYCLYLIFYFMYCIFSKVKSLLIVINTFIFVLLFLSPWYIEYLYVNYPGLDAVLSCRLAFFTEYLSMQDLVNYIFGGNYLMSAGPVDNTYLLILFSSGIIMYSIWASLAVYSSILLCKNSKYNELAYILALSVLGLFESSLLRAVFFFTLLYWVIIFYPYKILLPQKKKFVCHSAHM